jgi:predicted small integral membrane protein
VLGGGLGLVLVWFGFVVVGGNWSVVCLNPRWNGIEPAFQSATLTLGAILAVLLVAAVGEREAARDTAGAATGAVRP